MNKFLIIDGHALLFQMFYGMPNKILNSKNENIEAVIGFIGALKKIINITTPSHLLIIFDGENELKRKAINADYKSNRIDYSKLPENDTPFPQLEKIKLCLQHLQINWHETQNEEADDTIAAITNHLKNNNEIIICSHDKDFFQLINTNVSVFCYRGKQSKLWTNQEIIKTYKFDAKNMVTYKCLIGDASDNICGIKGVGPKTATNLILQFKNIFNLYENLHKVENNKLQLLLENNKDLVFKNFNLINLLDKNIEGFNIGNYCFKNFIAKTNDILQELGLL